MGLNQMDVVGLFMATTTRPYFNGDQGTKVFASFLKNHIDPKAKSESENRKNLRTIFDTVASHTERSEDEEQDRVRLQQNLLHAAKTFMENKILIKSFQQVGIDFAMIVKQEALFCFDRQQMLGQTSIRH